MRLKYTQIHGNFVTLQFKQGKIQHDTYLAGWKRQTRNVLYKCKNPRDIPGFQYRHKHTYKRRERPLVSDLSALELQTEASYSQSDKNQKGKKIVLRNLHLWATHFSRSRSVTTGYFLMQRYYLFCYLQNINAKIRFLVHQSAETRDPSGWRKLRRRGRRSRFYICCTLCWQMAGGYEHAFPYHGKAGGLENLLSIPLAFCSYVFMSKILRRLGSLLSTTQLLMSKKHPSSSVKKTRSDWATVGWFA